jgi:hypothetical protein
LAPVLRLLACVTPVVGLVCRLGSVSVRDGGGLFEGRS